MRLRASVLLTGLVLGGVLGLARTGVAEIISPGHDYFATRAGLSTAMLDLPAGFFGTQNGVPSDPVRREIRFEGVSLSSLPPEAPNRFTIFFIPQPFTELGQLAAHGVLDPRIQGAPMPLGVVDTIVARRGTADLPAVGSTDEIPIEIIALSLQSVDPLRVTYGPGPPTFFDVSAGLDPKTPQLLGSMALTLTGLMQGTFDSELPVNFLLTFTHPDSHVGPFFLPASDVLLATNVPWRLPEPSAVVLLGAGLAGLGAAAYRRRRRRS